MGFFESCKSFALLFSALVWSPLVDEGAQKQLAPSRFNIDQYVETQDVEAYYAQPPKFTPPNGPEDGCFTCDYTAMGKEWTDCSSEGDGSCWLKTADGRQYGIHTNYEKYWPEGKLREYYLEVSNGTINGDGVDNPDGKMFNGTYPGPWIRACWGDTIKVHVKNNLPYNGTTVHWHGLRQLNTTDMDGVNGVTQCPIAQGHSMTYTFKATQYGTSWAHSHYSLQYGDGLVAPITIFGPSSSRYDSALDPILITDWNHRSAFKDWQRELTLKPNIPKMDSVLINGQGNFAGNFPRKKFEIPGKLTTTRIEKGKKYLMRIINTSVDTTWIFSIDNHNFTVIGADFVPIEPYNTSNVLIGIGQRYHIILDATPLSDDRSSPISDTGDYWIRTIAAIGCKGFEAGNEPDERQGILRYNPTSTAVPRSFRKQFNTTCSDEPYESLKPILRWDIPPVPLNAPDELDIDRDEFKNRPAVGDKFQWWRLGKEPLWLDFSSPTITNLQNETWKGPYVVIDKNVPADSWIYMVIKAPRIIVPTGFAAVAHPMHLHGHDFALLAQGNLSQLANATLKFDNPPRRDTVLLPAEGFIVIAFKADNPGSWLLHCHIAWHASSGLALQIMERQDDLRHIMKSRMGPVNQVCQDWDKWFSNKSNLWGGDAHPFQDDSGV